MSPSRALRLVVYAHHELGHAGLRALLARREDVLAIVRRADDPLEGRFPDRIGPLAGRERIEVLAAEDAATRVAALAPDLVADFGFGLGPALGGGVAAGTRGTLVLAPRPGALRGALARGAFRRGAGPLEVTLTLARAGATTGALAREALAVGEEDDAFTLTHRVAAAAHELVHAVMPALRRGDLPVLAPPPPEIPRFRPEEARIDPARGVAAARDAVRACTEPFEGAWFDAGDGRRVIVWEAHPVASAEGLEGDRVLVCADGVLRLDRVQRPGREREP